jgi:hypothetical protein
LAGRTPHEATHAFLEKLRLALSCVTDAVLNNRGGSWPSETPHVVVLADGGPQRISSAELDVWLRVSMNYRLVEEPGPRGPWRVTTTSYMYALENGAGVEYVGYHWHPQVPGNTRPHLHVRGEDENWHKLHMPTGRIALEDVVRFAVEELAVEPRRGDWSEVLDSTQEGFEAWRTWPAPNP